MGEIAEMMLEGFMCEQCGAIIGDPETGESQGFPGLCAGCRHDSGLKVPTPLHKRKNHPAEKRVRSGRNHRCATCSKGFKSALALEQHQRDSHGTSAIRFKRTGRTIPFFSVNVGCAFFALGSFWTRTTKFAAIKLATSESLVAESRGFAASQAPGEDQGETCDLVEAVIVEGNGP